MFQWIDRLLRAWCGGISALALFALMWVTVVDVTGRKFFNNALPGGLEMTETLMVMVIFGALPLVSWRSEHVVFDTLDAFTSWGFKRWQGRFIHAVSAGAFAFCADLMLVRAARFAEYGDVTEHFRMPLYPVAQIMAVLLIITALVHVLLALMRPMPVLHAQSGQQEAVRD